MSDQIRLLSGTGIPEAVGHDAVYLDKNTGLLYQDKGGKPRPLIMGAVPPGMNLLQDTMLFKRIANGQTNTVVNYDDLNAVRAPWGVAAWQADTYTMSLEVITPDQFAAKGLGEWGELRQMVPIPGWSELTGPVTSQIGFNALLISIEVTQISNGYGEVDLLNPYAYTAAPGNYNVKMPSFHTNAALWQSQFGLFCTVLAQSGDMELAIDNMFGKVVIGGDQVGKGWNYYHGSKFGLGGYSQIYQRVGANGGAMGSMTYAIALPYAGMGNHGGIPIFGTNYGFLDQDYSPSALDLSAA